MECQRATTRLVTVRLLCENWMRRRGERRRGQELKLELGPCLIRMPARDNRFYLLQARLSTQLQDTSKPTHSHHINADICSRRITINTRRAAELLSHQLNLNRSQIQYLHQRFLPSAINVLMLTSSFHQFEVQVTIIPPSWLRIRYRSAITHF